MNFFEGIEPNVPRIYFIVQFTKYAVHVNLAKLFFVILNNPIIFEYFSCIAAQWDKMKI